MDGKTACVACGVSTDTEDIEMRVILESGKREPVCTDCGSKYDNACLEAAAILTEERNGY
jgi:NAD-dependent SIR2 family protein deacetylase|tara:strand:- start:122 stop:301 length:180 start_codon:yes stop_codon:yes gene_type:complete